MTDTTGAADADRAEERPSGERVGPTWDDEPAGPMSQDGETSEVTPSVDDTFGKDVEPPESGPARVDSRAERFLRFDCTAGTPQQLSEAAKAARLAVERGECIVFPTDTVYGIGADVFDAEAVQGLLDAKERGRDMPPPVLISEPSLMRVLAVEIPTAATELVARHWPGPLTVICRAQPSLRIDLGETEGTIALRVPDHQLAREVLRQTGPLAVSSANLSGRPAAVSCDEAVDQLGNRVAVYLDGGRLGTADRQPSTMVDFSRNDDGEVLRHGALSVAVLRETCPDLVDLVDPAPTTEASATEDPTTEDPATEDRTTEDQTPEDPTSAGPAGAGEEPPVPEPVFEGTQNAGPAGAHSVDLQQEAHPAAEGDAAGDAGTTSTEAGTDGAIGGSDPQATSRPPTGD